MEFKDQKPMFERAVGYCRVASRSQYVETSLSESERFLNNSLDEQESQLRDFAIEKKLSIIKVFKAFEPGSDGLRPEFDSMVEFVRERRIRYVVAESRSRLMRGPNSVEIVSLLIHEGVKFLFVNDEG